MELNSHYLESWNLYALDFSFHDICDNAIMGAFSHFSRDTADIKYPWSILDLVWVFIKTNLKSHLNGMSLFQQLFPHMGFVTAKIYES